MKVLFITKTFIKGGAATGASNLALALEAHGFNVVRVGAYECKSSITTKFFRSIERVLEHIFLGPNYHFLKLWPSTINVKKLVAKHKPDILQLGDVSGNVISFSELKYIDIPIVHRLSDTWPYLGAGHYTEGGGLYKKNINKLANMILKQSVPFAITKKINVVAPSAWLLDTMTKSTASKFNSLSFIRNCTPIQNDGFLNSGLKDTKKVSFGFISADLYDPRKGLFNLVKPLEELANFGYSVDLNLYGSGQEKQITKCDGVNIIYHGSYKKSEANKVYGTFDVLLCPSVQDNSPNVLTEALSFSTPVIGNRNTGIESYVMSAFGGIVDFSTMTSQDLQEFVELVHKIQSNYSEYSRNAFEFVCKCLSPEAIGNSYGELYKKLSVSNVGVIL
ncbi:MAG: glycosyltransferase [Algicola sp.]|nr:glycosyltransferase [Algicola sp.]